jgi:hypothetical protein
MTEQVPERSKDVPSEGDLGPNVVVVVSGREATNEELGLFRVVIEVADDGSIEIVKDNTGGAVIHA